MENELNPEEMQQTLRAMRVLATDITEEKFQALISAQKKVKERGFLETVGELIRLKEQQGIDCSQALDLLKGIERLEGEISALKGKKAAEETDYQQVANNLAAARNELQDVQKEIHETEKNKQQIQAEVEQRQKEAGVTQEEIAAAKQLKSQVEKNGFSLEIALELVKEFVPYRDYKERLTEALKTTGSITEYNAALEKKTQERERALKAEIDLLELKKADMETKVKDLKESKSQLEEKLILLKTDVAHEQKLREFYNQYHTFEGLLEYLTERPQLIFLRCNNMFCNFGKENYRFWTETPARKCPSCGLRLTDYDYDLYQRLKLPPGPVTLIKGAKDGQPKT